MQPQLVVAQPLNDDQIRMVVAAILYGKPGADTLAKAAHMAAEMQVEIIINRDLPEQIAKEKNPEFIARREAEIKEQQEMAAASQRSGLVLPVGSMPAAVRPNMNRRMQ